MAYRKASEENAAGVLGSEDFWAGVQNGADVRISVADILAYLRATLRTNDIAELPGKLQAISDTASGDLASAVSQIDALLDALQHDVDSALGQLDGSVSDKLDALQADVNSRVSKSQLGAGPNLVPVLDGAGKLDVSTIPAVAITDTFPVASQTEMLALTAERGDIAIRSDLNKCFVLKAEPASTLANWKELLTPTDAVLSVAGLTGAITASALKTALGIAISDVAALQAALDALSSADTQIRTDFAAADSAEATTRKNADDKIRVDFAAADAAEASARDQAIATETQARKDADTAIRTDFAAADATETKARQDADTQIRTDFAAADAAETKARQDADAAIRTDFAAADALKANLAGATFTGGVAVKANAASGSAGLVSGSDTRTGYTEFRSADGTRMGYVGWGTGTTIEIAAETGNHFNFNALPTVAGQSIWYPGNFDPTTKATLNASASFSALTVGTSAVWHAGNFNPADYAKLGAASTTFTNGVAAAYLSSTGDIRATGNVFAGARLVVGEGQTSSYIEMRDTDDGTRSIHNNSGRIGFLGSDANWIFQVGDDGTVWTKQFGDLSTRIDARAIVFADDRAGQRVWKGGDTMTGDLIINKNYPGINFLYPNVKWWGIQVRENSWLYFHENNGVDFNFAITPGGNVYSNAWGGYLTDHINNRAWAYADAKVDKGGGTMSGGLYIDMGWPFMQLTNRDANGFSYIDFCHVPYGHGDYTWRMKHSPSDNQFYIEYIENGTRFAVRTDGSLWCAQMGDLNSRIEDRARAYAEDRASRISGRLAYAGDRQTLETGYTEPWGACVTGYASGNGSGYVTHLRFRYMQMRDYNMNWYTCGLV